MLKVFKYTLLILFLLTCFACVQKRNYSFYKYDTRDNSISNAQSVYQQAYKEIQEDALEWNQAPQDEGVYESNIQRPYFDWELWGKDFDLQGAQIQNPMIKKGDELSSLGNFKGSLEEYQRAKMTAEVLHDRELTFWGRFEKPSEQIELPSEYTMTHDLVLLQNAILQVLARAENSEVTEAEKEHNLEEHLHATQKTSVEEKINFVVKRIEKNGKCKLCQLFENVKTRDEVVATFLALLELIKTMAVSVKYNSSDYSDCDIELCK